MRLQVFHDAGWGIAITQFHDLIAGTAKKSIYTDFVYPLLEVLLVNCSVRKIEHFLGGKGYTVRSSRRGKTRSCWKFPFLGCFGNS